VGVPGPHKTPTLRCLPMASLPRSSVQNGQLWALSARHAVD